MSGRKRTLLVAALLAAASAGVALGCGWDGVENSVRFGSGESDHERARLPPLPFKTGGAARAKEGARVDKNVPPEERTAGVNKLWDKAEEAVAAGDLRKTRALLEEYLARSSPQDWSRSWYAPKEHRERRNAALDRLDALAALEHGSTAEAVAHYLAARKAYDDWRAPVEFKYVAGDPDNWKKEEQHREAERQRIAAGMSTSWGEVVEPQLALAERDANLADNAAYLRAVGVYRAGQQGDALQAFEEVAAKFPRGEKRGAALYMAGLIATESSKSYAGGGSATSEDPCREADCRDEFWQRARRSFERVVADYPQGRFAADARGQLAYLHMRVGDTAGALAEYYRLLGGAGGEEGRDLAARSLRLVRARADADDMARVEKDLEDEPDAALAYAYHNIHNYIYSYYLALPEEDAEESSSSSSSDYSLESSRAEEQERAEREERAERKELRRVAAFAARMLARYPRAGVGAGFAVRVAAANFELGDTRAALDASRRALSSAPDAEERAKALWLKGAAEYRLKEFKNARVTLTRLAEEYPDGDLHEGSRRMLATLAEDAGDLAGALEQYLLIGYDADAGYFIDVLMTPDQLAAFVAAHEDSPRHDELLYGLGLRMMRAGRYVEARAAFARVRTRADFYYMSSGAYGSYNSYGSSGEADEPRHPKLNLRHDFWNYIDEGVITPDAKDVDPVRDSRVYSDWLLKDTQTLDRLEQLQREIERADGDEAKAEAMYQLASYFYEGSLVTYNPAVWRGMRATMMGSLSESVFRAPNEADTLWRYAQEHEAPARALTLYLEVVRLYPRTRAARDALYTAALCHQRLMEFNAYWRDRYEQGLHAGARMVTLVDVRRAYPDYRLPLDGHWEPSTRTVGGSPAWPAPPKARELTGMERARLKIKRAELRAAQAWALFGDIADGRVKHYTLAALRWTLVVIFSVTILLVFRLTRRTRAVLFDLFARLHEQRAPVVELLPAPSSSYASHEPYTQAARVRAAARDLGRSLFHIVLDERGRAALALNLLTHGLLTALLYALMWAVRQG